MMGQAPVKKSLRAIRGVPFLFLNMIGSPGEGEYGEKSDSFYSPRQAFVTVGGQTCCRSPVQHLIDSYNTYLTCTDSDFSNGASYQCKNISSSSTRAPSIGTIMKLRAYPL